MSTALRPNRRSRSASSRRPPLYPVSTSENASRSSQRGPRPPLTALPSPQSSISQRRSSHHKQSRPESDPRVRRLPSSRSLPLWLKMLIRLQRGSMVVTFILVVAALIVYGSTVYTQQLWSKEYRKLKTLERNEREMLAATEIGKDDLARQAERPGSGLVPQTPATTIFLQPAPQRSVQTAVTPDIPQPEAVSTEPLGY